jgi:pantetheine-phosphate adenylyltransferase
LPSALYPGSFDPFHNGHLDVVEQAVALFDPIVIATMHNPDKPGGFFGLDERQALIEASVAHLPTVKVAAFSGLAVDAARAAGVDVIVKGLRTAADFDTEMQMAHTNAAVAGVRTVFLPCRPALSFVSSRYIREIAQYGGDVSSLVPPAVARRLEERAQR